MGTRAAGSRPIAKPFGSTNSRSTTFRPKKSNNLALRQHGSALPASVIWRIAWILERVMNCSAEKHRDFAASGPRRGDFGPPSCQKLWEIRDYSS